MTTFLVVTSALFDIGWYSGSFRLDLAWRALLHPFPLGPPGSSCVKWVSCGQRAAGSCGGVHANNWLLISFFRPLTFKMGTAAPLIQLHSLSFRLPAVICDLSTLNGTFQKYAVRRFSTAHCSEQSDGLSGCPLLPAQGVNHPSSVRRPPAAPARWSLSSHLCCAGDRQHHMLVFREPRCSLIVPGSRNFYYSIS